MVGLLYGILGIVNPVMNSRVDWFWFVLSQFGFGLVAGLVVSRQQRVSTALPLSMRAGIEASGRGARPDEPRVPWPRWRCCWSPRDVVRRAARWPLRRRCIPDQVLDFATLFAANCAGCHGAEGKGGAALALADPVYLAIADDAVLTRVTRDGIPGSLMPAFAQSAGGLLTDAQVTALVQGIRSHWARADALHGAVPPPYSAAPG